MFASVIANSGTGTCATISFVQDNGEDRCVENNPAGFEVAFDTTYGAITGVTTMNCVFGRITFEHSSSPPIPYSWSYNIISTEWDPFECVVDFTISIGAPVNCGATYRVVITDQ